MQVQVRNVQNPGKAVGGHQLDARAAMPIALAVCARAQLPVPALFGCCSPPRRLVFLSWLQLKIDM